MNCRACDRVIAKTEVAHPTCESCRLLAQFGKAALDVLHEYEAFRRSVGGCANEYAKSDRFCIIYEAAHELGLLLKEGEQKRP